MTYRENTFGVASILNLIYKKSFIEVLFFTNKDVLEKGVPLLKIYTPLEKELDFNEIIVEPDFDDDGLISPSKIVNKMRKLIRKEFQRHLSLLEREVDLIEEHFENYPIENPYNRKIRIYFPKFAIELDINFEKYPLPPTYSFSKRLSKIISEREFSQENIIQNWDELNPSHIYELINKLCEKISENLKIKNLKENSQHLLLNDVSVLEDIKSISFNIHRGKSLGIIFKEEEIFEVDFRTALLNLFEAIAGKETNFSGTIKLFGKHIQLLLSNEKKRIFILPEAYDSKIASMKIKKAIKYGLNISQFIKKKKFGLDKALKKAELTPKIDEIYQDILIKVPVRIRPKIRYIRNALDVTGLLSKKNKKFSELSPLEFLMFTIARALIQDPTLIMFIIPLGILGRLEFEKFNNYINRIKQKYHVILLFHGPEGIISQCDKVLTITEKVSRIGSYDDLIKELPREGEIITIELDNPDEMLIREIYKFDQVSVVVEERKNEKYRLYVKNNPNELIINLLKLFGPHLFNFKRSKASLSHYLEFLEKEQLGRI
jgi:ABC-type multidrug transport system ATPase subunit